MVSILEGELADLVTEALEAERVPVAITITRTVRGEPDPARPWQPGASVITDYACRGWTETYAYDAVDGRLIDTHDVKVVVLTASITITPTDVSDTITVDGKTLAIVNVKRDASGALFEIQARL